MTDEQRARDIVPTLLGPDAVNATSVGLAVGILVAEFAAARLEERQTITVWLLEQTGMVGVADAIARGTYREATS